MPREPLDETSTDERNEAETSSYHVLGWLLALEQRHGRVGGWPSNRDGGETPADARDPIRKAESISTVMLTDAARVDKGPRGRFSWKASRGLSLGRSLLAGEGLSPRQVVRTQPRRPRQSRKEFPRRPPRKGAAPGIGGARRGTRLATARLPAWRAGRRASPYDLPSRATTCAARQAKCPSRRRGPGSLRPVPGRPPHGSPQPPAHAGLDGAPALADSAGPARKRPRRCCRWKHRQRSPRQTAASARAAR